MATLKRVAPPAEHHAGAHDTIGRSTSCDMRIEAADVSAMHAELRWTKRGWELRDLGSTNGTFVDGERLAKGGSALLSHGAEIRFGKRTGAWVVTDSAPPAPKAVSIEDGCVVHGEHGLVAVPSLDDPAATFYRDVEGQWLVDLGSKTQAVEDNAVVDVSGALWRFNAPSLFQSTVESLSEDMLRLALARLIFRVSANEEYVGLEVTIGARRFDLGDRSHHYFMLLLARQRLEDGANDALTGEPGWMDRDMLCDQLAKDPMHLNVEVYRARRELAKRGFADAGCIVERRRGSAELRIGCPALQIDRV